jgi:hypothetical protein
MRERSPSYRAWIRGELGSGRLATRSLQDLGARRADVIAALPSLRGKNLRIGVRSLTDEAAPWPAVRLPDRP